MQAYQDMVFSTAARLLANEAQAQDIAQDVFLKAYENFEQLRTSTAKGGWLKTVTTNLSLNHLSRYRRRWRFFSEFRRDEATEEESQLDVAVADSALDGIDEEERQLLLEQALRRLPEHQRVPLVLYHFEELSYEDIARQLRISLAKVRTDILRGRVRLAKLLACTQLSDAHSKPSPS